MVYKDGERKVTVHNNMRGGNLTVSVEDLMTMEEFDGRGRLFGINTIPPTGSIGYHVHEGECEAYYILQGEAKYDDNGTTTTVKAGDVTFCPSGNGHGIENIGQNDLIFIALILFDKK